MQKSFIFSIKKTLEPADAPVQTDVAGNGDKSLDINGYNYVKSSEDMMYQKMQNS